MADFLLGLRYDSNRLFKSLDMVNLLFFSNLLGDTIEQIFLARSCDPDQIVIFTSSDVCAMTYCCLPPKVEK